MDRPVPLIIVYMMGLLDGKGISYTLSDDNTSIDIDANDDELYEIAAKVERFSFTETEITRLH